MTAQNINILYKDTKANIEAISSPRAGWSAYATDTGEFGFYGIGSWLWFTPNAFLATSGLSEWVEQSSDPLSPTAGHWKLYFKSGGLYSKNSVGTVFGINAQSTLMEGLRLVYNSAASLDIKTGSCYAENGDFINVTSAITKSSLSLTNATWYHIYVYLSGGAAAAEVVTTAPVAWKGTAYSKTGDTSRRYVGSILAIATNTMADFVHNPTNNLIMYLNQQDASPFRILANGKATTETTINANTVVPVTGIIGKFKFSNTDASQNCWLGSSLDSITLAAGTAVFGVNVNSSPTIEFVLDGSRALTYLFTALPASGLYVDAYGYYFWR